MPIGPTDHISLEAYNSLDDIPPFTPPPGPYLFGLFRRKKRPKPLPVDYRRAQTVALALAWLEGEDQ